MKSHAILRRGLAMSLAICSPLVLAQKTLETKAVETKTPEAIETLNVYGSRPEGQKLSRQLAINNQEEFVVGARLDPAELLTAIPGVQVDSRTNYAQDTRISMRGFGARSAFGVRGIDLLVDGVPMSTPDGQGQLSSVMLDSIASAQVLRGPLAALYGNGAGGVIALKSAVPQRNQVGISTANGDQGLERYRLHGELRSGDFAARAEFADTTIDGDRPHSRAEREQATVQFFYTTAGGVDVVLKHEQSDDPLLEDPLGLRADDWLDDPWQRNSTADQFNTRKSVDHQQTSISLRNQEGATRWQAAVWQGERNIEQYLGMTGESISGSGGVVDLSRDFAGASATLTRDLELFVVPVELTLGGEIAKMEDRRRGYVNNYGLAGDLRRDELGEVTSRDLFSLININLSPRLNIYTGARGTWLDAEVEDYFIVPGNPDDSGARDYRERAFALGGSYQLADHWELFASTGKGYETPTLTEMAYTNNGSGLNTALEAAINRQHQWGLGYERDESLHITLTHFRIDSENEIVVDQSSGGRTTFRNAAETEREGVELLARFKISDAWRGQASAQSLKADYSAGQWSGNQLPGVAREQYQLGVEWRPLRNDLLQLNLTGQQRARIFTADNNQIAAPGFHTLDFSLEGEYAVQDWTFDWWLKLANIRDKNYVGSVVVNNARPFEPALGRNLTAGINLNYTW